MHNFFQDIDDSLSDTSSVRKKPVTRNENKPDTRQLFHDNHIEEDGKPYACSQMCQLYGCQYEAILDKCTTLEAKVGLLEVKLKLDPVQCTQPHYEKAKSLMNSMLDDKLQQLNNQLDKENK